MAALSPCLPMASNWMLVEKLDEVERAEEPGQAGRVGWEED